MPYFFFRLKAVESEHNESLANFKKKFLHETEDEVSKAVAKLKRDEEKRVQDLTHDFLKREKQKVAEAVEAERKIFEREFGNLTELHKVNDSSHVKSTAWIRMSQALLDSQKTAGIFL